MGLSFSVVDVEYHHLWAEALGVLSTALEISQVSVTREANLEAEILFNMGEKLFTSIDDSNICARYQFIKI